MEMPLSIVKPLQQKNCQGSLPSGKVPGWGEWHQLSKQLVSVSRRELYLLGQHLFSWDGVYGWAFGPLGCSPHTRDLDRIYSQMLEVLPADDPSCAARRLEHKAAVVEREVQPWPWVRAVRWLFSLHAGIPG